MTPLKTCIAALTVAAGSLFAVDGAQAALVAHWDFSGNADDVSGNNHDATLRNGASITAAGFSGQGLSLGAGSDFVSINTALSKDIFNTGNYTISGAFKTTVTNGDRDIFSATADGTGAHGILIELRPDGSLRFLHRIPFASSGGTNIFSSVKGLNDGEFHTFAAVTNGLNLELFVDDVSVGTATTNSNTFTSDFKVVFGQLGENNAARQFVGTLDEIKIFNTAETPDSIDAGNAVPEPSAALLALGALGLLGVQRRRAAGR